jgi:hypothetical protein
LITLANFTSPQDTNVDLGVVIRDHELSTRTPHRGAPSLPIASFSR